MLFKKKFITIHGNMNVKYIYWSPKYLFCTQILPTRSNYCWYSVCKLCQFEIRFLTEVTMNHTVFCDIAQCSLAEIHQLSAINRCFQLQCTLYYLENDGSRLLRNDGKYLPDYKVQHAKKFCNLENFSIIVYFTRLS